MEPIQIRRITKPIRVTFSNEGLILPVSIKQKIDTHWNNLIESGRNYTRGEIFTVTSRTESAHSVDIHVCMTDYAHYVYSRQVGGLEDLAVKTVHGAALIVTSDNVAILGEMGAHTARAGIIQFCGGGLDNNDLRDNRFDIDGSVARELNEEVQIDVRDASRILSWIYAW